MRLIKEARGQFENYHLKSGIFHFFRGELKKAEECFLKALENDAGTNEVDIQNATYYLTQTRILLGEKLEENGDVSGALEVYRKAASTQTGAPDIFFKIGMAALKSEQLEEAIEAFRKAIAININYIDARTMLAFACMRMGLTAEAEEQFATIYDLIMSRTQKPYEDGMKMLKEGKKEEAEEQFKEAFVKKHQRFEHHFKKALSLLNAERYEEAIEEFAAALHIYPRFTDVHNYLGIAQYELGRIDDAIESFNKSIGLNNEYIYPHINLAYALATKGLDREAESHLEFVISREPRNHAALMKLEGIRQERQKMRKR